MKHVLLSVVAATAMTTVAVAKPVQQEPVPPACRP
jgi:hypothetical protein